MDVSFSLCFPPHGAAATKEKNIKTRNLQRQHPYVEEHKENRYRPERASRTNSWPTMLEDVLVGQQFVTGRLADDGFLCLGQKQHLGPDSHFLIHWPS